MFSLPVFVRYMYTIFFNVVEKKSQLYNGNLKYYIITTMFHNHKQITQSILMISLPEDAPKERRQTR